MKIKLVLLIAVIAVLSFACNSTDKSDKLAINQRLIHPPLEGVDIPYQECNLQAEKGDTFFTNTGSILCFPPNSIVDAKGAVVKGEVKISIREFADPLDFFLAGIPMNYDSAGTNYTFESSGMIEVRAYKDNIPVFVNPRIKPEINLVSQNPSSTHNLYFLDTVQGMWVNKGKDLVSYLEESDAKSDKGMKFFADLPVKPLKPMKANVANPFFTIKIEPGSVPELQVYDKLKFEVDKDDKSYNPKDAAADWSDVKVEKTGTLGKYLITFTNPKRKVSIIARPVFEGKDYEAALKLFDKKEAEYNKLLAKRMAQEDKIKKDTARESQKIAMERERKNYLNQLIRVRNKVIIAQNKKTLGQNQKNNKALKKILDERIETSMVYEEREKARQSGAFETGGYAMKGEIMRTFTLERFGYWNCDIPVLQNAQAILAKFLDKDGKDLGLSNVTVVYKNFNGLFDYNNTNIKVIPNSDNMIWAVRGKKFIYLGYDEFRKCKIDSTTKEYSFTMNIYPNAIKSQEEIRKIVGL